MAEGNIVSTITTNHEFETEYEKAANFLSAQFNDWEIASGGGFDDNVGVFSVMVKRNSSSHINVGVTGTPLKIEGSDNYLGYKLEIVGGDIIYDSTLDPSSSYAQGASYTTNKLFASNVRDTKAIQYTIPFDNAASYGDYSAMITFTIELE